MNISEQLKNIRELKGIKQSDIAVLTNLKQQSISRIEQGENVTMNTLNTYANALGQDLSLSPQIPLFFKESFLYRKYIEITKNSTENIILSHIAAAELLGLFSGYLNEYTIEYYANNDYKINNTICHLNNNKNEIGVVNINGISCTDIHRTINDLLLDYDRIDDGPILESLNHYYFTHNNSFDTLLVTEKARDILSDYQKDAVEYS